MEIAEHHESAVPALCCPPARPLTLALESPVPTLYDPTYSLSIRSPYNLLGGALKLLHSESPAALTSTCLCFIRARRLSALLAAMIPAGVHTTGKGKQP